MVEARIRRLPGYAPMPDFDDGASEGGAFLWRLGDAFELWDDQGDALEDEEAERGCQPAEAPAEVRAARQMLSAFLTYFCQTDLRYTAFIGIVQHLSCNKHSRQCCPPMQEPSRAELVSPRRSRRSMHSPARPLEVPQAQTGYDSDDEGEGEPGATEAEELESAHEALPPPRAWAARLPGEGSPDEEGSAALDAPGPRLLDGYDTDPGGADPERRARRRALRRSITRGASALLALVASSGCCALLSHFRDNMTMANKDAAMLHISPDRLSWM